MHGEDVGYVRAAAELFSITSDEARNLFGSIGMSYYDYTEDDLDYPIFTTWQSREALLHRASKFFEEHGESFDLTTNP